MNRRLQLLVYLAAAIALTFIPVIHVPLKWFETLFHESSHALAAVLTGGRVDRLSLAFDGSGLTWSAGGWGPVISFAGYAGAIVWGSLLYAISSAVTPATARKVVWALLIAAAAETLAWLAFNLASYLIMAVLIALLVGLLNPRLARFGRPALRLIGAYVLISAIVSPTYILQVGQTGDNDAKALAGMLWVPSVIWVGIWLVLGLGAIAALYRLERKADQRPVGSPFAMSSSKSRWRWKR